MRHLSSLLFLLIIGLALEVGTSCTKQTVTPSNSNAVIKDFKATHTDSTTTSQPSTGHQCGNGHNGQG